MSGWIEFVSLRYRTTIGDSISWSLDFTEQVEQQNYDLVAVNSSHKDAGHFKPIS